MVVYEEHLLIEVLLEVILDECLLKRCTPLPPVVLLALKHLVELTLASRKEQLFEIHLSVLWVIKLPEKADAQLDVEVKERRLCRALHEDNFHQLLQE